MYKFNILNFKLIYDSQFEKLTIRNKKRIIVYSYQTKNGKILQDLLVKFKLFFEGSMGCGFGSPDYAPVIPVFLANCKIRMFKYKNNTFHIYCERPGLIIGKGGETIDKLSAYLGVKIRLYECSLYYPTTQLF